MPLQMMVVRVVPNALGSPWLQRRRSTAVGTWRRDALVASLRLLAAVVLALRSATLPARNVSSDADVAHCNEPWHGMVMKTAVVIADPQILSGTPVFAGTRVPVKALTDYLEEGASIDEFLDDFPTVQREQVIRFLEEARERMIAAVA